MIYAINYANDKYRKAQLLNSQTALLYGADKVIAYSPRDIDNDFYNLNNKILTCERGNGYWLWKPYFIKKTLGKMNENDFLIYSDSGSYFVDNINFLIHCADTNNTDIMVFSLSEKLLERMWSKRDAFILMGCDTTEYTDTPQRLAGFLVLKNTKFTRDFVDEWLMLAQDIRIISDQPNCMGEKNYLDFKENRHDQTILSLLSKKYHINSFRDPSKPRDRDIRTTVNQSEYPQIFELHRMGDIATVKELEERYNNWLCELKELWYCNKKMILYGAGKNADKIISYSKIHNMKIDACVISDNQIIQEREKEGIKVYYISELPYSIEDILIIVTIESKEVIEWLKKQRICFKVINKKCWRALMHFKLRQERTMVKL